jgi:hypothetical protein
MLFITPTVVEEDEVKSNESGRRGRSVSADERVAGQYDLQLGTENSDQAESVLEGLDPNMLSGDTEEEQEVFRRIMEANRRQKELMDTEGEGNYVPQAGVGSTTLNAPPSGSNVPVPGAPRVETEQNAPDIPPPGVGPTGSLPPPPPTNTETQY